MTRLENQTSLETLGKILERMREKTGEMGLRGTSVAAIMDGNRNLVCRSLDCGKMFEAPMNSLAIAFSKLSEMVDTLLESGSQTRAVYKGEHGWPGGTLKKVGDVYYLAAFSGAKGEEDLEIAKAGLELV